MNKRNKPEGPEPKVGDQIYIGSSLYIDHGEDDVQGGKATIARVEAGISAGKPTWFVAVKEAPGHLYNYSILLESQNQWREEFGKESARRDPDHDCCDDVLNPQYTGADCGSAPCVG